jgi:cysteine synthase A
VSRLLGIHQLPAIGTIVEGTGGNTGVGLALIAAAKGYKCILTMPSHTSPEKVELARTLGAEVVVCPPVPFDNAEHYYNKARAIAAATPGAVWCNQFENTANMQGHIEGTGPEIFLQTAGRLDAVVVSAGTGGTIGGLSTFFRSKDARIKTFLIDPPGSCLFNYVTRGSMTPTPGSTITEGIGIARLTANFAAAHVDGALTGTDAEVVDMAYYLMR